MEFNAYKGGTTEKGLRFRLNFQALDKKLVILGAIILTLSIVGGGFFMYNRKISTKQHAASCYQEQDPNKPIVKAGCVGDKMLLRKRILLCCPGQGCKFWKYEAAGYDENDPLCKNKPTSTPSPTSTSTPNDKQIAMCKARCDKEGLGKSVSVNNGICECIQNGKAVAQYGLECLSNNDCKSKICIDGYCQTQNSNASGNITIGSCSGKNGTTCSIQGASGICYQNTCYSNKFIIRVKNQADCQYYGAKASIPITVYNNQAGYLCLGCQNKPISQAPIVCQPPQCTGAKACVDPGTTSPGTDCIWYICDPKGSGLWIKTDNKCTEPAPTGTTNSKPTPTPLGTPVATFPQIQASRSKTAQCDDNTGGYTANYTINVSYPSNDSSDEKTINVTITENLDTQIDPAWVNNINNTGQIDTTNKAITWNFTLNKGDSQQLQYIIDYPSQALGKTYTNTANIKYGTDSLGYKTTDLAENTTASCGNTNDTPTPTPTTNPTANPTAVPNTGVLDNISVAVGALSTIVIGLIIGL